MMNPLSNPSYLLPPLIALFVTIILLVLVWQKSRRDISSRIFLLLLLSVGLWDFFVFGMRASPDIHHALPWGRAISMTGFATWVFFYHFTRSYTNTKGQRGILLTAYLLLILVTVLVPTDLLVQRMRLESYGYAGHTGLVGFFFFVVGFLLIMLAVHNLLKWYRVSSSYKERNRLIYLAVAAAFPILGGGLDGFSDLPPAAIWANLIFCIICSVAIVKYHLLDIRVVVRKSLVYLLVSIGIAIPYVSLLYLLHYILEPAMGPLWIHALIILLLAIILRPLYSSAQQLVDRLFYRDRYDYLRALEKFSREAQSIVNLKELSSTMTQLLSGALRTSSVYLLLPSEGKDGFVIVSSTGLESPPSGVVLRDGSPLVRWLGFHGDIISSEQLNIVPQLQSLSLAEKTNLERMGANLYVPIQTRQHQLSGILVLGQKLSQQSYSEGDKQLLAAVSNQMAIKLENAQLYNESQRELAERKQAEEREKKLQQELYLSSRLAAIGELAAGVAHEINNPLTGIIGFSERLLRKSTDEKVRQDSERIHSEAQRAAKIVQNLLTFARRHESKKEYSNINDILQKTLELRAYELKTSNIEVVTDLAPSLTKTKANFQQIEEVFLNIIINAERAIIETKREGKLTIQTQEVGDYIRVSFTDNGPGIPAEHLDKLFDPFFTTRGERGGTGLGLSICHGIVVEHGGRIYARSELGQGATFIVELPVITEEVEKSEIAEE
jgi:signal transduction histidine kinase